MKNSIKHIPGVESAQRVVCTPTYQKHCAVWLLPFPMKILTAWKEHSSLEISLQHLQGFCRDEKVMKYNNLLWQN